MRDTLLTDNLPQPDSQAIQCSNKLVEIIRQECNRTPGGIPFSRFMHLALYAPGLGYYSSGSRKFGEKGDFITAPEVSSLFSQCIARQLQQVLNEIETPDVLEFGAGSGAMAADMLIELERLDALPEHYCIIELSAGLRERQRQTITEKAAHLLDRVQWLDRLPGVAFQGVIVANEVLDAMPVECFRINEGTVEQLRVVANGDQLLPAYAMAEDTIIEQVRIIEQHRGAAFNDGYCSEFNPAINPWLASLYDGLERGLVLLIDYGYPVQEYYLDERDNGTLICHYQQRAHADPLWYPGLQDITAFVDFSAVASAAADAGFDISGYTSQAMFLLGCGLAELHQSSVTDDPREQLLLAQQIKTLTLPSEMGERFKAMALSKNIDLSLAGFAMQDYRNRL
ncbi:MAG: SAM-dependent methyltransferase [Gammaproteobacteria bacterium]|nr:SAM-dependent methyltransferase [Gammaproteobacteria bacterium]